MSAWLCRKMTGEYTPRKRTLVALMALRDRVTTRASSVFCPHHLCSLTPEHDHLCLLCHFQARLPGALRHWGTQLVHGDGSSIWSHYRSVCAHPPITAQAQGPGSECIRPIAGCARAHPVPCEPTSSAPAKWLKNTQTESHHFRTGKALRGHLQQLCTLRAKERKSGNMAAF